MAIEGKRIAMLVADIYEDMELWYPYYRLQEAGATVTILGSGHGRYESKHGYPAKEDKAVADVSAEDFDAVLIPGGYAPDHMRRHRPMIDFVKAMHEAGKIVAFICHAGWVPVSAGIVSGRTVTSFFSIKDDMVNAGADWVDEEVVRDGNLVSSRTPQDLPAYCRTIIAALEES